MNDHAKEEGMVDDVRDDENICRDFIRKVCFRGRRCKFQHPEDIEPGSSGVGQGKTNLSFCKNFQNGNCSRPKCRFIHCTSKDENYYLQTGDIPPHIWEQAICRGQITNVLPGDIVICKDYLMGECSRKRGDKCKFQHLSISATVPDSHQRKKDSQEIPNNTVPPDPKLERFDPKAKPADFERDRDFERPLDDVGRESIPCQGMSLSNFQERDREHNKKQDCRRLEEILIMRKHQDDLETEIANLKKEITYHKATMELLLDKIIALESSNARGSVTAVTEPAVSLASTIPVATSLQPLTAAQHSQPLPITSDGSVVAVPAGPPPPPPPQQAPQQAPPHSLAPQSHHVLVAAPGPAVVGSVGGAQLSLPWATSSTAVSFSSAPNVAQAISMSVPHPTLASPDQSPQPQSMLGYYGSGFLSTLGSTFSNIFYRLSKPRT